jgi:type III pantothenate kinase
VLRGERLGRQSAFEHAGLTRQDIQRQMLGGLRGASRIVVCSVGGQRLERLFKAAVREVTEVKPQFAASARTVAGVTTRYTEPWRLGVDRFMAVIAAHRIAGMRGACVIDAGTAMTVDLIDGKGVHLGGAILPAPDLMVATLLRDTSGISSRARGADAGAAGGIFARNTRDALRQGASFAAAAVIDRAAAEAQRLLGRMPLLLLTGGGVEPLIPLVQGSYVSVPDLVLRGTALYAGLVVK